MKFSPSYITQINLSLHEQAKQVHTGIVTAFLTMFSNTNPSETRTAVEREREREFRLNQPNFIKSMKRLFMQQSLCGLLGLRSQSLKPRLASQFVAAVLFFFLTPLLGGVWGWVFNWRCRGGFCPTPFNFKQQYIYGVKK